MWRNSSCCDNLENWDNFIASHTAALAQDWIKKKRPGFIGKNECPMHSPDLSPLACHVWGAMLGLNAEKAADIHHWNVWTVQLLTKKLCKVDSLLLNIQDATVCSLEKVNFKV